MALGLVIRGDMDGFALYFEEPEAVEPGEFIAVFPTLTEARRAQFIADKVGELLAS